ncbi:MAG: hypothetical protein Q9224_002845 [Gallowayella concinna]
MESRAKVDIVVFPEEEVSWEDSDGSIQAQTDSNLAISIISEGMLTRLRVGYTPCQRAGATDSQNVQHFPVGKIALRWHKKEQAKSYHEIFFVVESMTPQVILGASAFENSNQSTGGNIHPIGLQHQTAGTPTNEEKLEKDRKNQEVVKRREKEKKEQEEKEAERRRQIAQKK